MRNTFFISSDICIFILVGLQRDETYTEFLSEFPLNKRILVNILCFPIYLLKVVEDILIHLDVDMNNLLLDKDV